MRKSITTFLFLLSVFLSSAFSTDNRVKANDTLPVVFEQLGQSQGGQALKATISTAEGSNEFWSGENFLFQVENGTNGSVCTTHTPVSNGAGEVFASCINPESKPFFVYLEHVTSGRKSELFEVNPAPLTLPISGVINPNFPVTPPVSLPVSLPGQFGFELEFITEALTAGVFAKNYTSQVSVISTNVEEPIAVSFAGLPDGITASCEEGLEFLRVRRSSRCYLRGIPTVQGTFTVMAEATAASARVIKQYVLDIINQPLSITSNQLRKGQVQVEYKDTIQATDPDLDDSVVVKIEGLPQELSYECSPSFNLLRTELIHTCKVSGTPQTAGTYQVHVLAHDQAGNEAKVQMSLVILPEATSGDDTTQSTEVRIGSANLKKARTDLPYFTVIQGTTKAKYGEPTLAVSGLPEELSSECHTRLNFIRTQYTAYCEITGVPTTLGLYEVMTTLTDGAGNSATALKVLEVVNQPVKLRTDSLKTAWVDAEYRFIIKATDSDVHDVIDMKVSGLPEGLAVTCEQKKNFFSTATISECFIQGTATTQGVYAIEVEVSDGKGHLVEQVLTLRVR